MKKHKTQKVSTNSPVIPPSNTINENSSAKSPVADNKIEHLNEITQPFELIRFDKKLNIYLGICVLAFLILSLLKIHGSSVASWNDIIPEGSTSTKSILAGTPKRIRMDEYAVLTPFTLSQYNNNFPTANQAIGGQNAPLIGFVPVNHFVTAFRPNFWAYYFLSQEQAFAWAWNFKTFGILISVTLMLMLLTGNNLLLSIFGGFWLLYSSGTQWWYSTSWPDCIFLAAILFTCAVYLIFSKNIISLIISTLLFVLFSVYYATILYPPYQLPLAYFVIFLLAGYVIHHFNKDIIFDKLFIKLGLGLGAFAALGIIFFKFYSDAKPTIEAMMNTAYPGKRTDFGGSGFPTNMFSEYYHLFVNSDSFPQAWINICELSHYINFAPVIVGCMIWYYATTQKINYLVLLPSIFVVFILIWIKVGFPESIAKLTLMSMSPPKRTQIPFGVANVILAIIYVSQLKYMKISDLPISKKVISIIITILFMGITAATNDSSSGNFFKAPQLVIGVILFGIANIMLLFPLNIKFREVIFTSVIAVTLVPNIMVNPIAKGLAPITEHNIYQQIKAIDKADPHQRWMVNGSQFYGYITQATGVNVLGGVKYVPDFKTMKVIDGKYKRDTVYNRYAHTVYSSYIDGKDSTVVALNFEDGYSIGIDGCSPRLKELKVKYMIFDRQPQPVEVRCMKRIADSTVQIYQRND
ncbi:hypothetical protein LV89_03348 [Arcicella aurantiaca]|uniref:Uncharacterized protein n=1 Tax=Arcicella aurantiaca TaxID=591202 RepID=A0A316DY31_9BACT|nr:hypothetical protein [Arcicella aurantiaca]PWK22636.1 hypothetical protein LV89_03348 [Arcicella aurantiaca]